MPLVRRTRATLRRAEFGFFGVCVATRVHTPRRCGAPLRAGVLVFSVLETRPLRTSWLIVGNANLSCDLLRGWGGRLVTAVALGRSAKRTAATAERPWYGSGPGTANGPPSVPARPRTPAIDRSLLATERARQTRSSGHNGSIDAASRRVG